MNTALTLAHHAHDQLVGRMTRRLTDAITELDVCLAALRSKTTCVEVATERAELVIDALRAELKHLEAL